MMAGPRSAGQKNIPPHGSIKHGDWVGCTTSSLLGHNFHELPAQRGNFHSATLHRA